MNLLPRPFRKLTVLALLFYAVLAIITLYPILKSTGTHTAGYDFFAYNWNFWYTRHALTQPDVALWESNYLMFPHVSSFGYHTLTIFWFPIWALLEPIIGTLAAVNVILFIGCTLNGFMVYLLLRSERIAPALALLGGAVVQILPISRYFYYNTHLNLMDWFLPPFHILLWKGLVTAANQRHWRKAILWALVNGIALWWMCFSDLQSPIFVGFLLVPYGLYTLWHSPQRFQIIALGIFTLVVTVLLLWFLGPLPYLKFEGKRVVSPADERPGIQFIEGFFTMSETWWDHETPTTGWFITVFLLVTLIFALVKRNQPRNHKWFWFAAMIPPMLIAMGPTLKINGTSVYYLVFDLTDGMFRMPWRLGPVFAAAGMVFAGKVWTPYLPKLTSTRLAIFAVLFLSLFFSVRLFETAPLQPLLTEYEYYEQIGEEEGQFGIVEIPTGAGTGEVLLGDPMAIQFQWYGMKHHKPMVNGFIARANLDYYWYMEYDDPMLAWLGQRRDLEPEIVEAQMRERILGWPIGYFVIHQDYVRDNGKAPEKIIGFFNSLPDLLCPPVIEGEAIFYRTASHPDGCDSRVPPEIEPGIYQIDIGSSGDERYIGWGWHYQETVAGITLRWAGDDPQTLVYLDLAPGAYQLQISAQAFHEPRTLRLQVNGEFLPESAVVSANVLNTYSFTLPADLVGDGKQLQVALVYDDRLSPQQSGLGGDPRSLAVAVDWIQFVRD